MPIDCTAPAVIAGFQGDDARCKLVVSCQSRLANNSAPVPPEIQTACGKALKDWKAAEQGRAASEAKRLESDIKALTK